ncbi:MAG: SDR family NAD(P)-dependent oxidoreductase [Myxococcota bacterium]
MHGQRDAAAFRSQYGPWALVAGASDGIGESFARQLAAAGLNIVLLARREALLEEVAGKLRSEFEVETRTIVADLTGEDLDQRVAEGIEGIEVGTLVYNAGAIHGAKPFHDHPVEQALGLVNLNCRGPVLLAHRLGGAMRERGRGGILLLTSMAGLSGSAYTATYAATKSFDLVLAESLWHELSPRGVHAMAVVAGATKTPSMLNSNEGFADYPNVMDAEDVAKGALANLGGGPVWVAGAHNRATAAGLLPVPRTALINGMSEATAQLYDLPFTRVDGKEFGELDAGDA